MCMDASNLMRKRSESRDLEIHRLPYVECRLETLGTERELLIPTVGLSTRKLRKFNVIQIGEGQKC